VTDYDCWHPGHDAVTVDTVVKVLAQNVATARAVLRAVVKRLPLPRACECEHALRHALLTPKELVPEAVRRELEPLVGRYLGRS
jgi:5'-methylthioadenosine phosphorylase